MTQAVLEHVNFTVPDAAATAAWLCEVFGWKIRWQGAARNGGRSIHVGTEDDYLVVFTPKEGVGQNTQGKDVTGAMNHIGVVVDDLDAVEVKVKAHGFPTFNHADYEPGRRFYFEDENGIEFEVVSYG
ncbi:glyoxalase [Hoeflea sp. BAL378]|uniref:VOC family protein n=1 Tax=Hoeflea sp. BAL378 TaxID=1547437 RepID=UPI000513E571|nr:VOC family protein [Hoeflea sp. BAL378]KGF68001.1 glyoxalase [Hoeflea sp. BAL378]